jgi:protocatechuate 3,4-dioxygenase alpha subunit
MSNNPAVSKITTAQTIGPFPHEAWKWATELTATVASTAPQIVVTGTILDGDGIAISDAWIETWMPDSAAVEAAQEIPGYRRVPTDPQGSFRLQISLPQAAASGKPVAYVTLFGRGMVKHQFSAVFLEDDSGLAQSALLAQIPAERRATLLARKQADGSYVWNIHMQGVSETVFFDYT